MCSQRPYSIRTRIKTPLFLIIVKSHFVRDHIPLEQGLRPSIKASLKHSSSRQRPYSIRTRIKTHPPPPRLPRICPSQRPYSIRTRIKTATSENEKSPAFRQRPYSQGQRPYSIRTRIKTPPVKLGVWRTNCQRPYSIRTRIKTSIRIRLLSVQVLSETIFH